MKLAELKKKVGEYQYLEDTGIIDVSLASILSTQLSLGDPVWLVIIGASSGGKSQILRPLSLTNEKFIHRIDDVTENTFLSGMKVGKGDEGSNSLLLRIGSKGIIVVSDLTVLFSKSSESRATILSQFRMIYDGEMTKYSGSSSEPIKWKGHLGVMAGSTPSIYGFFEEVSDMGERFIYYRMKEYDPKKATSLALGRKMFGRDLDDMLGDLYKDYLMAVVRYATEHDITGRISPEVEERIINIASFAERARTPVAMDFKGEKIMKKPVSAMPMRVALQLKTIAKALSVISHYETGSYDLSEEQIGVIEWCGYSLANEEKRACLRALVKHGYGFTVRGGEIAEEVGLSNDVVGLYLQNLSAVGIVKRSGSSQNDQMWTIPDKDDFNLITSVEGL